jgi:hypothetical protein
MCTELCNAQATDEVTVQLVLLFPAEVHSLFFAHIIGPAQPSSIHAKDSVSKMARTLS